MTLLYTYVYISPFYQNQPKVLLYTYVYNRAILGSYVVLLGRVFFQQQHRLLRNNHTVDVDLQLTEDFDIVAGDDVLAYEPYVNRYSNADSMTQVGIYSSNTFVRQVELPSATMYTKQLKMSRSWYTSQLIKVWQRRSNTTLCNVEHRSGMSILFF